jgi:hypothetical protein
MDKAVSKKGQTNTAGEALKDKFSYDKVVDSLIKGIKADI